MSSSSYQRSNTGGSSGSLSSENLPPRTIARLVREVRDFLVVQQQMSATTSLSTSNNREQINRRVVASLDDESAKGVEGVRLILDHDTGLPTNLGELVAELEGPVGTPYEGKLFHFKLIFCQQYPSVAPRGFFLTKIYHPNVDISTGAICVNTLKRDWTSSTTLSHIVNVIRCLLIVPFPESSLNDEAGKLFMESYTEYFKRAKLMADVHGRSTSYYTQQPQNSLENSNKSTTSTESNTFKKSSSSEIKNINNSSTPLRSSNQNTSSTTGLNQNNSSNPSKITTKSASSLINSSSTSKKGLVNKQKSKTLKRL